MAPMPAVPPILTEDDQWRRLDARMLLIHPVRELVRALPALAGLLFAGSSSGKGHLWGLIGVAAVIVYSLLRWFTTRYRITSEQVQLRTGLFRRRSIATPADRVRTVDVTAHALHRVLGLAKVVVGTGTSDRNREGLVLDGLSSDAANLLRAELLHRRAPAAEPVIAVEAETAFAVSDAPAASHEVEIIRLDPKWIGYAPFTLSGVLTGVAIAGLGWQVITQGDIEVSRLNVVQSITHRLRSLPLWLDVLEVTLTILTLVTLLSIAGYVLSFWNFRLTRHDGGTLHVSRGLLTVRATSIEETRLQGVELSEPLLLRAVGGARLVAIATGLRVGRGAERGGTLLLPPGPSTQARRVAAVVLDEDSTDLPLILHGPAARRRRFIRAIVPCAVLTAVLALQWLTQNWSGWFVALSLVPLAAAGPLAADRYRSLGHAVSDRHLITRFGSLARRHNVLARDGIIGWNLEQTFFQRRAGLATLTATTAAGKQRYRIPDVNMPEALDVAVRAMPGLFDEFLIYT
jgi:putative membrane protein